MASLPKELIHCNQNYQRNKYVYIYDQTKVDEQGRASNMHGGEWKSIKTVVRTPEGKSNLLDLDMDV
jgi:hypothetical protein